VVPPGGGLIVAAVRAHPRTAGDHDVKELE
jgi:hypothetical protein